MTWLLWLALVLPWAQAAAHWHAYSHVVEDAAEHADAKQALHLAHCDLCLAAAALADGAPASAETGLRPPGLPEAAPQEPALSVWTAPATPAYRSRAPPISAH